MLGAALALTAGPASAETKQRVDNMDTTVQIDRGAVVATAIIGGTAEVTLGSARVRNGATQEIGTFKSNISVSRGAATATTIIGGTARLNLGSAVAD
jgi:hypothetical protein